MFHNKTSTNSTNSLFLCATNINIKLQILLEFLLRNATWIFEINLWKYIHKYLFIRILALKLNRSSKMSRKLVIFICLLSMSFVWCDKLGDIWKECLEKKITTDFAEFKNKVHSCYEKIQYDSVSFLFWIKINDYNKIIFNFRVHSLNRLSLLTHV